MKKIFLAEDDASMISLLSTLLSMEGYQVIALQGDEDVVSAIQQARPDIVLLDIHLPNANGVDVIKRLRTLPETADTRIVVASGSNKKDESLQAGADAFLLKPYMPDDLLNLLNNYD